MALFAVSIQYQPSAALPLIASKLSSYHGTPIGGSLLLAPSAYARRASTGSLPRSSVTFSDVHSLLTTPKVDPMPETSESTNLESLFIRTEFRTRRTFSQPQTSVRFTNEMRPGTKKIVRHAKPTITVVTERVTLWNTVIVDHQVVARAVVQRAQPGLVLAGPPRNVAEAMAASGVHKLVAVYAMVATAYTADSAQAVPTGRTATGLPARYGVVAVDPRVIRLGSHLYIEGYGAAIAADTGGAIRGNRIDLCMDSLRSAINWGRQPVKVYVLQE
jgi:3D (Asp-Asp-Asp) domain-containing protein